MTRTNTNREAPMAGWGRPQILNRLRDQIAAIERQAGAGRLVKTPLVDEQLISPPGFIHEVFANDPRDHGAALGFSLKQAARLVSTNRRTLLILQLAGEVQELGVPYGAGLAGFGLDPHAIVLARLATPADLLWVMEEALGCRAVAAVVADVLRPLAALDFTASRRLSLRAAATDGTAFILRYGLARQASAARLRWQVEPVPSAPFAFDPRAPGAARWRVALEKGRLRAQNAPPDWLLEWTDHGFVPADHPVVSPRAAVSRALSAALADRLPQAG